jgi:hypothetical protein
LLSLGTLKYYHEKTVRIKFDFPVL